MRNVRQLALLAVGVMGAAVALRAAEPPASLRVGAASADITPETDVLNWVTGKPYGVVLDPLSVHIVLFEHGATKAALVRWDLVDVSESAREAVRERLGKALGMPGENVLVHASHSHSAPWAPIYREGFRGKERDTWWALRFMPPQNAFPPFARWMEKLLTATEEAARTAQKNAVPANLWIGRIAVPEYLYNRRPRAPAWGLAEARPTPAINYNHADWHPEVAQGGTTFGPMDRTLSLVSLRDEQGRTLASLFHVACHAVSVYPSNPGISADWPGMMARGLSTAMGGESLFLQGTAGDITPGRRGAPAAVEMAEGLVKKTQIAARFSVKLSTDSLLVARSNVDLPLTPVAKERLGATSVSAEIQVITCGPLALVGLPGEPLTDVGEAIRAASPFPQTLVLGYSNGNGAHYVGMPGEKARGGYEAGVPGAGDDTCGTRMVEAAVKLLRELEPHARPAKAAAATRRL